MELNFDFLRSPIEKSMFLQATCFEVPREKIAKHAHLNSLSRLPRSNRSRGTLYGTAGWIPESPSPCLSQSVSSPFGGTASLWPQGFPRPYLPTSPQIDGSAAGGCSAVLIIDTCVLRDVYVCVGALYLALFPAATVIYFTSIFFFQPGRDNEK